MKAPQYTQQMEISRQGMNLLRQLVENELKWMLRPTHLEDDFGIDAYIDVVSEDRLLTGKTIAIQVKTGKSYFDSRNGRGWCGRFESRARFPIPPGFQSSHPP